MESDINNKATISCKDTEDIPSKLGHGVRETEDTSSDHGSNIVEC